MTPITIPCAVSRRKRIPNIPISFALILFVTAIFPSPKSLASPTTLEALPTEAELATFREEAPVQYGEGGSDPEIDVFIFDQAEAPENAPRLVSDVAQRFGISEEAALHATKGALIRGIAWGSDDDGDADAAYRRAADHLWKAAEAAPQSWAVHESLAHLYADWNCQTEGLLRVAQHWGDLRDAALRSERTVPGYAGCNQILMAALGEYPSDLELIAAIARLHDDADEDSMAIAIRKYAFDLFVTGKTAAPEAVRRSAARAYIGSLLVSGSSMEAVTVFESLPVGERSKILAENLESETAIPPCQRGIAASERSALDIELASAYLVSGYLKKARELMKQIAIEPPESSRTNPSEDDAMEKPWFDLGGRAGDSDATACWSILKAASGEPLADPFGFLIEAGDLENGWSRDPSGCSHSGMWLELLARLAVKYRYPEFNAYFTRFQRVSFESQLDRHEDVLGLAPEGLAAAFRDIEQKSANRTGDYADDEGAELQRSDDPISRMLRVAIAQERPPDFSQRELPTHLKPVATLDEEADETRDEADLSGSSSPYDLWREDRVGDRIARITLNQDYDPVGEVSGGGYWLQLSDDAGRSWQPPLYTGLRDRFPYVIRRKSNLPLLNGDQLQPEVAIDEIDLASIMFPPIGLSSKRQMDGIYLAIPLKILALDSDGDGLTDLAERALFTDPKNPDTDGDEIPDARDRLPHVPRTSGDTERAFAMAAALTKMFGGNLQAHVIPANVDPGDLDEDLIRKSMGMPARLGSERTLFLVGERDDFGPIDFDQRTIVLTPEEADAIGERRGVFYPSQIILFVLDHERKRGFVIWSASWTGGRFKLERTDNGWIAVSVSEWIT